MEEDYEIEIDAAQIQAASDQELSGEVVGRRVVTLGGREFRVAEKVGLMPLLKFSHAANLRADDERAYAALYSILKDVIYEGDEPCGRCPGCKAAERPEAQDCQFADPGDWEAFEEHATRVKADGDDLLEVVSQAMKLITARPTELPASSSNGSRGTSRKSTAGRSSARAVASKPSARARRAT